MWKMCGPGLFTACGITEMQGLALCQCTNVYKTLVLFSSCSWWWARGESSLISNRKQICGQQEDWNSFKNKVDWFWWNRPVIPDLGKLREKRWLGKITKGEGSEGRREDVCNMDLQIVLSLKGVLCEPGCTAHTELAPVIFWVVDKSL